MKRILLLTSLSLVLILQACSGRRHRDHNGEPLFYDRSISIEVEVYDPVSGLVWQDVQVRIVEVDQEWSGLTNENPVVDWFYSDADGLVYFDDNELAIASVGFRTDQFDRAVISPEVDEDEAVVVIEVYSPGLGSEFYEVDLSWDEPRVQVSLPF